jgi:hypothetical protein
MRTPQYPDVKSCTEKIKAINKTSFHSYSRSSAISLIFTANLPVSIRQCFNVHEKTSRKVKQSSVVINR